MARLGLRVLGPPQIEIDGEPAAIVRRKATAMVVYLAVTGQRHSRDALATMLWPENDQSGARAALRRTLWEVNNALGEGWLEVDRESVGLNLAAGFRLDTYHFRLRLAETRAHNHTAAELCSECVRRLTEAMQLYQDDFLAGFTLRDCPAFDEWQFFQAETMRRELAEGLEKLVRYHGNQGQFEPAIDLARRWLALDPLHEPVQRHLMQLYAWSGQRAAALRQYQECVRLLQDELGAAPQRATTQLKVAIQRAPQRLAYLRVVSGPGAPAGERFVLTESTTMGFGRHANSIHLADDYVSEAHARIEHRSGSYLLRDLQSTNGTHLNERRLEPDALHPLDPGDEIRLGDTRLIFEYAEQTAAAAPEKRITKPRRTLNSPSQGAQPD